MERGISGNNGHGSRTGNIRLIITRHSGELSHTQHDEATPESGK